MSTLYLVRHGQASFGTDNYDRLSDLGRRQSHLLGAYWAARGVVLDAVVSGKMERQRDTLLEVGAAYRERGLPFPEPTIIDGFNEYDARGIMTAFFPKLLETDERIKAILKKSTGLGTNSPDGRRSFQEVFEIVVDHWVAGEFESDLVESWRAFQSRVMGGVERLTREYKSGKTVAVFTSGGPISAILKNALGTSDKTGINLSWVVRNASITEIKYGNGRSTLTGFNAVPHLGDDSLVTYR